jgi:hypothetical protein
MALRVTGTAEQAQETFRSQKKKVSQQNEKEEVSQQTKKFLPK